RFGPFEADLRSGELSRDGRKVPLQDKPFHILALLVERPGELVTRDELRQRLWPADTFVDFEHGLNTAVKKLRQGLDDSAEDPGLLVISGNTAFLYRGRPADVRRMASDLHVTHVLEGSVQRADGQLRVSAQIIDAKSGYHVWAEKYDRPARDIFALQDDISD